MLETVGYKLIGILEDEVDAIESLETEHDGNTYICDAIAEVGDKFIPIDNHDVWKNAEDIEDYIKESVFQMGLDTDNFSLTRLFQGGYYQYYTESLYNNLDAIMYNRAVKLVNEKLASEDTRHEVLENIAADLDDLCEDVDHNDTFDQFDCKVIVILEEHTTARKKVQ
ncbi:hypothetical protein [Bacillus phage SDFMU_Pbc]|uniref:Uncharacterized protein n=1 Tax=Bacillus phage SDFMU_Pbc TaxID=3076135 RepID=A0AA96KR63_9CAUD|nr:hypothetical protein [Bacillus phage SDFMU_Pbc]